MPVVTGALATAWTPPPTITNFSGTVFESDSHIELSWDASTLSDADFVYYIIYRRNNGETEWSPLVTISSKTTEVYKDYSAGQATVYNYLILQYKAIAGDVPLASADSDVVTAGLTLDAWFIIGNFMGTFDALEINVSDEEHSGVIQQEIFEPLAIEFKRVVRGLTLGEEGSFTAFFDAAVAQATRAWFQSLTRTAGPHILKSPFGDVWAVEFDAPAYKHTTGGHLNVSMGWVQIQ